VAGCNGRDRDGLGAIRSRHSRSCSGH
jgi:hypothetical protein